MNEICSYRDEVFVAQCLVSMSKERDGPSPVVSSDEEYPIEEDDYATLKSRHDIEGMIPACALPDPHTWDLEKNSKEQW